MKLTTEQMKAFTGLVTSAESRLRDELAKRGVVIITTKYSHSTGNPDVIDGTQAKGFTVNTGDFTAAVVDELLVSRISKCLDKIVESVLANVDRCTGSNGYLLNFLNVICFETSYKVALRGCPTVVPEGFDFERACVELTADPVCSVYPYGYDLLCHPSFVSPAPFEDE